MGQGIEKDLDRINAVPTNTNVSSEGEEPHSQVNQNLVKTIINLLQTVNDTRTTTG